VAVKPQLACFERLGAPGWGALEVVCAAAREAGLLVIADGKRGDVPVTAAAYAQALVGETPTPWGAVAGLGADAFTANPLLGRDALEPLLAAAEAAGAGMFAPATPVPPTCRTYRRRPRRCTSGWLGSSMSSLGGCSAPRA
jgi:orotidine-5'-phosphate decarboxylase